MTRPAHPLDAQRDAVIAAYVAGATPPQLAEQYQVSRQAVHGFLGRHLPAIAALEAAARAALQKSTIITKQQRVAALEQHFMQIQALIEMRRQRHKEQHPHLKIHELEAVDVKLDMAGGEHFVVHFDHPLSKELRAVARDIAEEQGEIVRKSESVLSVPDDEDGNARPIPLIIYRAPSEPGAQS